MTAQRLTSAHPLSFLFWSEGDNTESRKVTTVNYHIFKLGLCNKYPYDGICFQLI